MKWPSPKRGGHTAFEIKQHEIPAQECARKTIGSKSPFNIELFNRIGRESTFTDVRFRPGGDGHVSRKLSFVGRSGAGRAGYTQPQRTGGIKAQSLVGDAPKFSARREKRLCLLDFFFV